MGGIRGSGVVSSADDVSVMFGVRSVGGVCEMCMCLARGVVGASTGFGLYQYCRNKGSMEHVSAFGLQCFFGGEVELLGQSLVGYVL